MVREFDAGPGSVTLRWREDLIRCTLLRDRLGSRRYEVLRAGNWLPIHWEEVPLVVRATAYTKLKRRHNLELAVEDAFAQARQRALETGETQMIEVSGEELLSPTTESKPKRTRRKTPAKEEKDGEG